MIKTVRIIDAHGKTVLDWQEEEPITIKDYSDIIEKLDRRNGSGHRLEIG